MNSFQYTTPSFTIKLEDGDLDDYKVIIVTLKKGSELLEFYNDELFIDGDEIGVSLSQEQTADFTGTVKVQVNVLYNNGDRRASRTMNIQFDKNLHEEIIS